MTGPRLSVVVPVRNGLPYIREAIDSALSQMPSDSELIIRDNFSTDGTAEYLAGLDDPRVTVITSERSLTAGENWTEVCRAASGEWVKILCADDFITPGGLDRQLAAAEADPSLVMVASRRTVVDADGRVVMRAHGLAGLTGRVDARRAVRRAALSGTNPFGEPSSVLLRRDALTASLPFTERFPYLTDLDMYVKVLQHGDFVGLSSVDGGFRLSPTSWSQELGNAQYREIRDWLDDARGEGRVRLGPVGREVARVTGWLKFVARRAVNALVSLRSRSRTA